MSFSEDGLAYTFMSRDEQISFFQQSYRLWTTVFLITLFFILCWDISMVILGSEMPVWLPALYPLFVFFMLLTHFLMMRGYRYAEQRLQFFFVPVRPSALLMLFIAVALTGASAVINIVFFVGMSTPNVFLSVLALILLSAFYCRNA